MEQLTKKQIGQIDTFIKGSYVQYDDVRIEMIDHLAIEIEIKMTEEPERSFGSVLWEVGHSYGNEFRQLVKIKERELTFYWARLHLQYYLKKMFSWYLIVPCLLFLAFQEIQGVYAFTIFILIAIYKRFTDKSLGWSNMKYNSRKNRFLIYKTYHKVVGSIGITFYPIYFVAAKLLENHIPAETIAGCCLAIFAAMFIISPNQGALVDTYLENHPELRRIVSEHDEYFAH